MKKDPWFRNGLIRSAIYRAVIEDMEARDAVHVIGEGAHMKVHFDAPEIERRFSDRVITLPISEDGNSNFAVGLSLGGIVPIVDVISSDFLYRTMDAICNTMAKAATVSEPRTIVVKSEFLTGGPTSGQRVEALFAHIPGLRVTVPSNPDDAYDIMSDALRWRGVTVLFEDRMIEDAKTTTRVRLNEGGFARVLKKGRGPVVAAYGIALKRVEEALWDSDATIVDLRYLWPLDVETVKACLLEQIPTRRLLVVEPDVKFLGIGAELAATVVEDMPDVRVMRIGAPRATIPASRDLHEHMVPTHDDVEAAYRSLR